MCHKCLLVSATAKSQRRGDRRIKKISLSREGDRRIKESLSKEGDKRIEKKLSVKRIRQGNKIKFIFERRRQKNEEGFIVKRM